MEAINEQLGTFYTAMDTNIAQAFLSSAAGAYLDAIGLLLDCARWANESDDNYRYRISKYALALASCNETAIYFAVLSHQNVRDVVIKKYPMGIGSFMAYVIPEAGTLSDETLAKVQQSIDEKQALGIRGLAVRPAEKIVDLSIRLYFTRDILSSEQQSHIALAISVVTSYLNNLYLAEPLIVNEIIQRVMDISDQIVDLSIEETSIDGKAVLIRNYQPQWDEILRAGTIAIQ